jgi:hypothetical protein
MFEDYVPIMSRSIIWAAEAASRTETGGRMNRYFARIIPEKKKIRTDPLLTIYFIIVMICAKLEAPLVDSQAYIRV